jgi:hypothetical protein
MSGRGAVQRLCTRYVPRAVQTGATTGLPWSAASHSCSQPVPCGKCHSYILSHATEISQPYHNWGNTARSYQAFPVTINASHSLALRPLLIRAGDVERNPGPAPRSQARQLITALKITDENANELC